MPISPGRKPGQPERRRDLSRVPHPIMVRYRVSPTASWHSGPVRDFSRAGARLICEEPVKTGELLELWLGMPLFVEPVAINAKVIWQKSAFSGRLQLTEVGLSFPALDPQIRMTITAAVVRFLKQAAAEAAAEAAKKAGKKPEERPKS